MLSATWPYDRFCRYAPQYVRRMAYVGIIQSHIVISLRRVFVPLFQDVSGDRDQGGNDRLMQQISRSYVNDGSRPLADF